MFQLTSNLNLLAAIIEQGAREAADDTVDEIAVYAAEIAPRDTGEMADGIKAIHVDDASGTLESGSADGIHQSGVEVPAPYASLVHYGFGDRAGQPFLEEAGNEKEGVFQEKLGRIGTRLEA